MRNKKVLSLTAAAVMLGSFLVGCTPDENETIAPTATSTEQSADATTDVTADSGLLREVADRPEITNTNNTTGEIVHPSGTFTLGLTADAASIAPVESELPTDVNWQSDSVEIPELLPVEGEKFLIFEVTNGSRTSTDLLSFALETNGTEEALEIPTGEPVQFVKSVPADTEAEINLLVKYDGVTQELNLLTKERASTGIAETYYAGSDNSVIFDSMQNLSGTILAFDGGTVKASANIVLADRQPYVEGLGWADEGTSDWVTVTYNGLPYWEYEGESYIVDTYLKTIQWSLKDDQGNEYSDELNSATQAILGFKVATNTNNFELVFTSTGEVWENSNDMTPQTITTDPLAISFE